MKKASKDALGDRMKAYERTFLHTLPKRLPVIIRVDGKAFHTLLRGAKRPFDKDFKEAMDEVGKELLTEVQGAVLAYLQSDEVNLLAINYQNLESQPYFANEIQKIASITASVATRAFNKHWDKKACFDSRCFILPKEEVCNYFLWRQRDWERNSVQMVARSFYSQKQLHTKNNSEMQDMIFKKGTNWGKLPIWQRRGRCIYKENYLHEDGKTLRTRCVVDNKIPVFSKKREFINKYVYLD